MKKLTLLLVFFLSLFLVNCEKVDHEILTDPDAGINSSQLKSAQVNSCGEMIYLYSLIEDIESMVEEGLLSKGNGNALIVKITNAMKSVEKCNTTVASKQLGALINQLEAFVKNGILPEEQGELLITRAENGIAMLKLINTTWDFIVTVNITNAYWHADVTFYADGTTRYDEPVDPGTFLNFGVWSMEGNTLYYKLDASDSGPWYHFIGTLSGTTMSGTCTFPAPWGPFNWTATLK